MFLVFTKFCNIIVLAMKLIVGLGNPGKKYEHTRHNMGFDVLDLFSAMTQIDMDKEVFKGIAGKGKAFDEDLILFKPTTFMNLSGTAVQEIVHFFKIPVEDIIVIYDEMALKPGQIRLRKSGSCGGHNGIRNIIDLLGTENIKRIRVGIDGFPIVMFWNDGNETKFYGKMNFNNDKGNERTFGFKDGSILSSQMKLSALPFSSSSAAKPDFPEPMINTFFIYLKN